jgi:WD40 repeat protein
VSRHLASLALVALACRPPGDAPAASPPSRTSDAPASSTVEALWLGARLPTHPDGIAAIAVHGDVVVAATEAPLEIEGRTIGAVDPGVRVWHGDGRLRAQHGDAHVVAIAMVPGDRVATADVNGRVRVVGLDGGTPLDLGAGARVVALGWIAARERLAVVRGDGRITLVELSANADPSVVGTLGREATVAAIGRKRVVIGGTDGTVVALDLDAPAAALRPHSTSGRAITALAIAPDDGSFAAGDMEGEVFVARIGGATKAITARDGWPVRALAIMPSGDVVVSTSTQGQYLRVYAPDGDVELLPAFDGPYDAVAVDGARLVAGSRGGVVSAFDVATKRDLLVGARNVSAPRAMAFDAEGGSLVTYAHPDPLRWSLAHATTRELVAPEIWPLAIAPGGARAVVVDGERGAWAWNDVGSDRLGPWQPFSAIEVEVAFAGDVLGLAGHEGGQRDGPARFELRRGDATIASWRAEDHVGLRGFVASPDGTRWASLDGDDRPHVWTASGERVCEVAERRLNADIVFGRDGGELVLASQSHGLEILDAIRCTTRSTLWKGDGDAPQGTTDAIWALASAPSQGVFATGHGSGIVRLWSLVDGRELWSQHAQSKLVEQLVFDGSGRRLASAAQDGSLVVYRW